MAEVLIPPAKRIELAALIMAKPEARYITPTAIAVGNRIGGVFATLSWANRQNYVLPDRALAQLVETLKYEADEALFYIGVKSSFKAIQTAGQPLSVDTTVELDATRATFSYTFTPSTMDFTHNWHEMRPIAKARWERYVKSLTDADVKAIFELAKHGYSKFLTGDSAAEQKAKIKHAIAMERMKAMPEYYKGMLHADKYDEGYEKGAAKYKDYAQNIAYPSLLFGFEFAKAVIQVL